MLSSVLGLKSIFELPDDQTVINVTEEPLAA